MAKINLSNIILVSTGTMVSAIFSIITVFTILLFLPLLNNSDFLLDPVLNASGSQIGVTSNSAGIVVNSVYPLILVLIPLFTFIAGLVVTILVIKAKN